MGLIEITKAIISPDYLCPKSGLQGSGMHTVQAAIVKGCIRKIEDVFSMIHCGDRAADIEKWIYIFVCLLAEFKMAVPTFPFALVPETYGMVKVILKIPVCF